ncbi:ankyrin repeat domain-containing protein [Cohnella sp. GCM10027633]|uniref:ankyrin repeat domain-containing protein n=1 Tax=unclassified Cohnella TaxID=2636738 RepID=UPI003627ACDF
MQEATKDSKDETALMIATQKGNIEAIDLLLKAKSDVNAVNSKGETALSYAVDASQLQAVQRLLDSGADANLMAGSTTLLTLAVRSGNAEIVKLLLDQGADSNKQQNGRTVLFEAVQKGLSDVTKILLDAGADPNVQSPEGDNLLFYTLDHEQPGNAKQLIEHGADLTLKTKSGVGLLTLAKTKGYSDVADALIAKGVKDVSLLTYTVATTTDGFSIPKPLDDSTVTLGAHQNHPNPQMTFNLNRSAKFFKATFVSGRKEIESDYNVRLTIESNGKKLYESDYLSIKSAAQNIAIDVSGVQKLTFILQADKLFSIVESKGLLQNPTIYFP